ncbi:MAG: exonuclease domain-containing protein [Acidimicrobiales bacterium]
MKPLSRVPELVVGFDTETTGLDVTREQAISYGFCLYRYGQPVDVQHFFVVPDRPISDGARRVHGLSREDLEVKRASHDVLSVAQGVRRAVALLDQVHDEGGYVVGANLRRFDLAMLRHTSAALSEVGVGPFDPDHLRIIDVIENDLAIEPVRAVRPRRSLTHLCAHYGVSAGGHDAAGDARAAVEVLIEQVVQVNAGQRELGLLPPR